VLGGFSFAEAWTVQVRLEAGMDFYSMDICVSIYTYMLCISTSTYICMYTYTYICVHMVIRTENVL